MKFSRLVMPMIVLGIMFTMSSMVFGQANVTCSINNAPTATVPAQAAAPGGTAVPATAIGTVGGVTLQGTSANGAATGHTEVPSAGQFAIPSATNNIAAPTPGGQAIRIACTNNGATGSVGVIVLTVNFPVPITNTQTHPAAATGIRVVNGTGNFVAVAGAAQCLSATGCPNTNNVGIGSINNAGGQIVIGLGTPTAVTSTLSPQNPSTGISFAAGTVSTFDLDGVLLSTNGKSGEIDATLTEQSGNVNIGNGTIPVIGGSGFAGVQKPLTDPVVPTSLGTAVTAATPVALGGGPAVLNNSGGAVKGNFTIKVTENYSDLFKSTGQFNGGATFPGGGGSSTQVNFIFKNVPAGLNISGCFAVLTTDAAGGTPAVGSPTVSATNVTATAPILTVGFNAPTDVTDQTTLWLTCTSVSVGSATLPLPSAPVTVQVEMAPLGTALSSLNAALTGLATGLIPRYQDTPQPASGVTVVVFPPSSTNLLATFAVVVPGFNTGIAISNTTTDPLGAAGGGATPLDGTVVMTLFKNDGTSKTFTSPTVKSGTAFAANLSDIISSAGAGPTFSGYIWITANFPNAHGAATIYDTSTGHAALSTPVLVVTSAGAGISSANPRSSAESLGQ